MQGYNVVSVSLLINAEFKQVISSKLQIRHWLGGAVMLNTNSIGPVDLLEVDVMFLTVQNWLCIISVSELKQSLGAALLDKDICLVIITSSMHCGEN